MNTHFIVIASDHRERSDLKLRRIRLLRRPFGPPRNDEHLAIYEINSGIR
jgi:hypothetical protein